MRHRITSFVTAIILVCGLGLVGSLTVEPAHALAASDFGVGPSQTNVTGTARACEATAANHGLSNANGLQCIAGTASLTFQFDQATCTLTLTGSGLIPGSEVWFYSLQDLEYISAGTVDSSGNFFISYAGFPPGYSNTLTPGAYATGADPNLGATPYFQDASFSFSC